MKSKSRVVIGFVVSVALLWLTFQGTNWNQVLQAVQQADYLLLGAACFATFLGVVLRVFRWRALFWPHNRDLANSALFDSLNLGYMANNLLPARVGDLLRSYFIGEWTHVSVAQALATTVVERVLDLFIVVVMLFGLIPFLPLPAELRQVGALFGGAVVVASLGMVVLTFQRELSHRLLRALLGFIPGLDATQWADRLIKVLDGFAILRAPGPFLKVLGWSVIIWADAILAYVLTFRAFDQTQLGGVTAALTIVGAAFGMALPGAPSAVGTFHAGATAALRAQGVTQDMAATLAVTLHATNFLTLTMLGFWSLARRGLRYTDLTRRANRASVITEQATS